MTYQAPVAQLVVHWTFNPRVAGSSPAGGTTWLSIPSVTRSAGGRVSIARTVCLDKRVWSVGYTLKSSGGTTQGP